MTGCVRWWLIVFALLVGTVVPGASAQTAKPLPAVEQRLAALIGILDGGGMPATQFSPEFLAHVPPATLRDIADRLKAQLGEPLAVDTVDAVRPQAVRAAIRYERGTVSVDLEVDRHAPHLIVALIINGLTSGERTLAAVADALARLPGMTGFTLVRLDSRMPVLIARNADTPLAIGSAFKLAILAELIRATNAGERHWNDPVTIGGGQLPGGAYFAAAKGTSVTIRELAEKMISVSDNSATDLLLAEIGREKLEALLPVIGWRSAARNRPFLSVLDRFKLEAANQGALARKWLTLDEAGRRAMLGGEIAETPISAIDTTLFASGRPIHIDTIDWFASPADLVRTLDWIRRNTQSGPGAAARDILAINPGVGPVASRRWAYLGYKGGSETGLITMSFLLRDPAGNWYAMTAGWNDATAAIDDQRFIALMSRAVELAPSQSAEHASTPRPATPR